MKRLTSLFIFLLMVIATLVLSCKKDLLHEEIITGIVLHTVTKQPLTNQSVYIWVTTSEKGPVNPDEWPGGTPIFISIEYYTKTDNNGRFEITTQVGNEWVFGARLITGEYIQKSPGKNTIILWSAYPYKTHEIAKQIYDTILAERPGFVQYEIKNIDDTYPNDTLFVNAYSSKLFGQQTGSVISLVNYSGYNWIFPGQSVGKQIRDTVPAESLNQIPVTWVYKRTDTITKKIETINVQVGNTANYQILY